MKRMVVWVMSALLALTCINFCQPSAIAAQQNLVANGSFEKPTTESLTYETSIPGWQLSAGSAIEIQHGIAGKAYEGEQLVELDANEVSQIFQEIPTEVGKTYQLRFAFSPHPGASENKLNVRWGDTTVAQLDKNGEGLADSQWQVYTYDLKATSPSTRLSFDDLNETSDGLGSYIDAVSVVMKTPQYATRVIDFSSQYSSPNWSAQQALGKPNTFQYGDIKTAWTHSSQKKNSGIEFITLGYDRPVFASGVVVRETSGNGFVTQVDVVDTSDKLHTVWKGVDPSQPGSPVDFAISWEPTSFLVKGVKIYVDTKHSSTWEEIDSVELR
jgi:hypothetical protein